MEFLRALKFDKIIRNLNILRTQYENYRNLADPRRNFFVFPQNLFNTIKDRAVELNELLNRVDDIEIKKNYIPLSDWLYDFLIEIKKSSFENELFRIIIEAVEELKNFRNRVNSIMNGINDGNESENIIEEAIDYFQKEHNKSINFYGDFINNININNLSGIQYVEDGFLDEKFVKNSKNVEGKNEQKYLKIKQDFIYKSYYANILVKDEDFNKESLEYTKKTFPECNLLFDFKKIQDELIVKQCKIEPTKLNFKYNFIIPNLNLNVKKGNEVYYPPYGWFGIGINVKNLYENNIKEDIPKATAYYGFKNLKHEEIKIMLHIIMHKGLKTNCDLQPKCRYFDIRRKGKFVGNGIYLTPKINIIEKNTGIVYFNEKAYKVALMVRVITDKIRQPDDDYWILQPNEIEIIRIIFKEIYFD